MFVYQNLQLLLQSLKRKGEDHQDLKTSLNNLKYQIQIQFLKIQDHIQRKTMDQTAIRCLFFAVSALTLVNADPIPAQSNHQVVFKSIGTYATNVNYHHVRIPLPLGEFEETPAKAMKIIEKYTHNIFTNSLEYFKQDPRNYQVPQAIAEEAAILTQNQNMFVFNNSMSELEEIQEDLRSITGTLPTKSDRETRQIGLLFGIGSAIFASKNYLSILRLEKDRDIERNQIKAITHILDIDKEHFKHLDIQSQTNRYLAMQQLQFNPVLLESSAQNIVFRTLRIADKIMGAVQQLQVHRLSTNLFRGSTIVAIFKEMQQKADKNNMELLINSPSDLFKVEVSYFYKPDTKTNIWKKLRKAVKNSMKKQLLHTLTLFSMLLSQHAC